MLKLVLIGLILHVCFLKATSQQGTTNSLVCSKGSGWYQNSDPKIAVYCDRVIKFDPRIYYCRIKDTMFDLVSKQCKPASQVVCKPPTNICANGTGYYTDGLISTNGCKYYYYCVQTVTSYVCPTVTFFNVKNANSLGGNMFLASIMCTK